MSRNRAIAIARFDPEAPLPPYARGKDYLYHFRVNVEATSGTVNRGQHHGNRVVRSGKPRPEISGAALMSRARRNMDRVAEAVAHAAAKRWTVRTFFETMPRLIHHDIEFASQLRSLRTHETGMDYGCPSDEVRTRWTAFQGEFALRLERGDDPIETTAWAEYQIRFGIHPLADGCGRLATATGAWIMLLHGRRIPTYAVADRSAIHEALRTGAEGFTSFYRRACIRPEEVDHESPPFERRAASRAVA